MNSQGSNFMPVSLGKDGVWFESKLVGFQSHGLPLHTPFPKTLICLGDSVPQPLTLSFSNSSHQHPEVALLPVSSLLKAAVAGLWSFLLSVPSCPSNFTLQPPMKAESETDASPWLPVPPMGAPPWLHPLVTPW